MENKDRTKQGVQRGEKDRQAKGGRKGQAGPKYKGGCQGQGGIPNPDDPDDRESAGSFRGTAEQDSGGDDDEGERGAAAVENRNQDLNSQIRQRDRNPK